jgi:hypothetical protein
MRRILQIFAVILLVAGVLTGGPAYANKKVALVIGNGNYAEAPLKNPANDARAIAATLRQQGFEVLLTENATKLQMNELVADFGEKLSEGDTALFFFAGHGLQVQGRNYLMPTDARITSEQRVRLEALDVEAVLDQMSAARARVSMVILDACRNNPFERRFRSTGGGLAQINAPEGTMIAYATAPGKVAADGDGTNGLYTQELLRALAQPGLKVEDVFKQVRINVARASNGAQVPWEASSLTGDFYFKPLASGAGNAAIDRDAVFWESIKNTQNPTEIEAYLAAHPDGAFVGLARARLETLPATRTAESQPPSADRGQTMVLAHRSFNGVYSANLTTGVVAPLALYMWSTVSNGRIRFHGSGSVGSHTFSTYICDGAGQVNSVGDFDDVEIVCNSFNNVSKSIARGKVTPGVGVQVSIDTPAMSKHTVAFR